MSESPADGANAAESGEYVVVARRYRPQAFDELIGQGHVAEALTQAIRTGRVGHAYLFTGARGVGKTSAARILARALNCVDGPTPTPCTDCDPCRRIAAGDDVDVLEIDGASNRGIDEIRQLRQNAGVRPSRGRLKIYIIDEVHMLTKEAFNALLKTLEEPPEHVKFIFATTEPQKIPITILSRCQRFDFAGVDAEAIGERLQQIAAAEGAEIEPEAVQTLAVRAAGSMRDSQSLLEQLLAVADGRITADDVNRLLGVAPAARVAELAEKLAERDAAAALGLLADSVRAGADPGQVLDQLMGYYRDVLSAAVGCPPALMLTALPAQHERARALGERVGVETLLAAMQVLDQTAARMRVSVHERALCDMALVRIAALESLDDLAQAIADVREHGAAPTATKANAPPRASKKNVEPPSAVTAAIGPPAPHATGLAASVAPAPTPAPEPGPAESGAPEESLMARLAAELEQGPVAEPGATTPRRVSRRQQLAEVTQRPYVEKAMQLFGVEPDRVRYTPPQGKG